MPILESTDKIAPRSILRHRPIEDTPMPASTKSAASAKPFPAPVPRASRPSGEVTKMGTIVAEWRHEDRKVAKAASGLDHNVAKTPTPRISYGELRPKQVTKVRGVLVPRKAHRLRSERSFWLYLLLGMTATLLLWMILSAVGGWFSVWLDDLHYGRPRTFQIDARVGHNNDQTGTPSHFIAINLHQQIEVIELPGGDASKARIFIGPELNHPNSELVPIELRFVDLNKDHKLDMVVLYQQQRLVYLNDRLDFRLVQPDEQPAIAQALRQLGL